MYYVMRASAPSLHRESTDSLIRTLTILMTVWLYKMTCLICIHGVVSGSLISMKVNMLLSDFPLDLLLHYQIKYTSSTAIQLLL